MEAAARAERAAGGGLPAWALGADPAGPDRGRDRRLRAARRPRAGRAHRAAGRGGRGRAHRAAPGRDRADPAQRRARPGRGRPGRRQRRLRAVHDERRARDRAGSARPRCASPTPGSRARRTRSSSSPPPAARSTPRSRSPPKRPEADLDFYGLMALLGIYVGVIPVSLGMLWLPFVRRIDPRWIAGADRLHRRAARLPRDRRRARGAGDRRRGAERVRRQPSWSSPARWSPTWRWPGSTPTCRGRRERGERLRGDARRLPGAAGRDRDRPAQPRRGPGDRLRLRERGAGARRLPGHRLRDPQHDRGAGDRRAAARGRGARRRRPGLSRLLGARPDRRRAGDPRRLDRRRRLQPQPGGAALRRRRRRDRRRDRPAGPRRCATIRTGVLHPAAVAGMLAGIALLYVTGLLVIASDGDARHRAATAAPAPHRGDRGLREGDLRALAGPRGPRPQRRGRPAAGGHSRRPRPRC